MSEENLLQKFRELLEDHSFIKCCFKDDFFLLAFLRARKLSFDDAIKVLEGYFIFRYEHQDWFDLSDKRIERYRELVKGGFSFLVQSEDESLVMITNGSKVDVEKFTIDDIYHCFFVNFTLALFNEESQKSGLKIVSSLSDVSVKQIGIYPVNYVAIFGQHMATSCPINFQQYTLIGVPSFATKIVNALKMALPENIRNQMTVMNDNTELPTLMNVENLPEEFGGKMKMSDMIEKHLKNFDDKLKELRKIAAFELDLSSEKIMGIDLESNFKQLNID